MTNTKINFSLLLGLLSIFFIIKPTQAAYVYVDANGVNSSEDGSVEYPFHTISRALGQGEQILVKSGNYNEEITLPENATLLGEDKNTVIIDREGQEGTAVTMGKNSAIENVTVRGGNYSIVAPAFKKSTIRDCVVEKSKRIGVWIKKKQQSPGKQC